MRVIVSLSCLLASVAALFGASLAALPAAALAQEREQKVRKDKERFERDDRWIYNNLPAAFQLARKTDRPLLVVLRCIPCEACSQFDKQVIEEQSGLSELLDQFVCARVVHANGLDLSLFQFDFDQSFHAIMLNADQTIYGRFGTRSHRPEEEDMTLAAMREALQGALKLHREYPANRDKLSAKRASDAVYERPEEYPSLKGKYKDTLNYEGQVVQSCIHCHQVREAERLVARSTMRQMPDRILYPYPLPDVIGLRMDPEHAARVAVVEENSPAFQAGLLPGDSILEMNDQPLLSIADLQWVLHWTDDEATIPLVVERNGAQRDMGLKLESGWRRKSDISWRATSWDLRRIATGGLYLEEVPEDERPAGLARDAMALRARHVGEYGEHATALKAGFKKGDIIIAVDGRATPMSETELIAYGLTKPRGTKMQFQVLRDSQRLTFSFAVQ